MDDESAMRRAVDLARGAAGWTNPNPLVGAVVCKGGRVIGEGRHERCGEAHAERNALASCTEDPRGATMYVTLEPCCHTGRQPPCTRAIAEAGIARVVVGSRDPNPLVAGKGVSELRRAGISVDENVLRDECDALNPVFFHYITTKTPYVVAKWAMTADGKTATAEGDARWVTGEAARADVHEMRHRLSAIMVGSGTVLADDPLLTCRRNVPSRQPVRIVCDSRLRIPEDCRLLATASEAPLLVAAAEATLASKAGATKAARLEAQGAEVLGVRTGADERMDLKALIDLLAARQIDSVLLEGGATLAAAAFEAGIVNAVAAYVAPKVAGGRDAKTPVEGAGIRLMADALALGAPSVEVLGNDVKLTYPVLPARKEDACSPA